jgi:hypothetical protein
VLTGGNYSLFNNPAERETMHRVFTQSTGIVRLARQYLLANGLKLDGTDSAVAISDGCYDFVLFAEGTDRLVIDRIMKRGGFSLDEDLAEAITEVLL